MGRVATAYSYLVALLDIAILKEDMKFFYLTSDIVELEGGSLIVSECILIPVVDDRALDICVETAK
jgi:hypothetical protein